MNYETVHPDMKDLKKADEDIFVVSSGFYSLDYTDLTCSRPNGRGDYFLYYILQGKSRFMSGGVWHEATSGDIVFYNIYDVQQYIHIAKDKTKLYWVHFKGDNAGQYLKDLGITKSQKIHTEEALAEHFEEILKELTFKKRGYFAAAKASVLRILTIAARALEPQKKKEAELDYIISLMHNMENRNMSICDYADICNLSRSQFIRAFTAYTGFSPKKYQNALVMKNARWYLRNTELTIQEISSVLKFENVYYFSNAFKSQEGISPKEYRDKKRKLI